MKIRFYTSLYFFLCLFIITTEKGWTVWEPDNDQNTSPPSLIQLPNTPLYQREETRSENPPGYMSILELPSRDALTELLAQGAPITAKITLGTQPSEVLSLLVEGQNTPPPLNSRGSYLFLFKSAFDDLMGDPPITHAQSEEETHFEQNSPTLDNEIIE